MHLLVDTNHYPSCAARGLEDKQQPALASCSRNGNDRLGCVPDSMNWNAVDWYACRIYSLVPRLNAERVYGGELKRGGETPQVLEKGSLWVRDSTPNYINYGCVHKHPHFYTQSSSKVNYVRTGLTIILYEKQEIGSQY